MLVQYIKHITFHFYKIRIWKTSSVVKQLDFYSSNLSGVGSIPGRCFGSLVRRNGVFHWFFQEKHTILPAYRKNTEKKEYLKKAQNNKIAIVAGSV